MNRKHNPSLAWAAVALAAFATPALAAEPSATCIAELQCRGDAERMCAPSTLQLDVQINGRKAILWIDHQGPYTGELHSFGAAKRVTLENFGGTYQLDIDAEGHFLYRGNRGKRFTGNCEGAL